MKYADLHTHTVYSDGVNPPRQNVSDSALLGMNVMAITDHDTTRGYLEAKEEAKRFGIKVLTGTEISTIKYHILGYDFDIENKELQELLKYSRKIQENVARQRVEKIRATGVPIDFEKLKHYFPKSRLGKQNIAMTLIMDTECRNFLGDQSIDDVFETYLRKNGVASRVEENNSIHSKEAINAIHNAGGIAIVAHPFKQTDKTEDIERLIRKGADGLEIQPNYNGQNDIFKKYALERELIVTYGSDYHGAVFTHRPLLKKNGNLVERFWR